MNPFRRIFNFEPHFPFQYVYRDIKLTQHELPDHVHDWYELVYVHDGEGTFLIDHTFYEASTGSIFLIPGNTIHRSFPNEDNPKLSSAFYFSALFVEDRSLLPHFNYLQVFDSIKASQNFKLVLDLNKQKQFEQLIEAIHSEFSTKQLGYEQLIQHYLKQMLILLARHAMPSIRTASSSSLIPNWLSELFLYIDLHLNEELQLHLLAKRAAVSPPHLSRVFKQYTGMNLTHYVNAKKMMRAKDLLLEAHYSVSEVAELCGFGSLTHFHRTFKHATGMTPMQFKKSNHYM